MLLAEATLRSKIGPRDSCEAIAGSRLPAGPERTLEGRVLLTSAAVVLGCLLCCLLSICGGISLLEGGIGSLSPRHGIGRERLRVQLDLELAITVDDIAGIRSMPRTVFLVLPWRTGLDTGSRSTLEGVLSWQGARLNRHVYRTLVTIHRIRIWHLLPSPAARALGRVTKQITDDGSGCIYQLLPRLVDAP